MAVLVYKHYGTIIVLYANQDMQEHPCFTAAVEHKWNTRYGYLHG